ncbi:hypothetical protein KYI92_18405 [Pantoea allii]|uniref:Uncharacterized protein n=1 Tax=Pantoea allii TaxID=574096 RepID=A0ABS6VJA5_9GAMM|nr:hypothetical protein [Pantoea allii]MBW1215749.1 hypothetical protein [Pantoea allii]MBW1259146.1 hypothetical protein [Pantoea allii]MBW1268334.1 hypothetical protein [Pantoea allii]MBW1290342.1 hypothetical protein [Pantoea allii]
MQNDQRAFSAALASLQGTASNFAAHCIQDSRVREQYLRDIQKMSAEFVSAVESGKMSPREAATLASQMRNEILDLSRLRNSPVGRAFSQKLKLSGRTMADLTENYATKMFQQSFVSLSERQQATVFKEIIQSAGRDRGAISGFAKTLGVAGKRVLFVSLAVAAYEIYQAEDKTTEVVHQGALATAGIAGGWGAGAAVVATGVCAATAPVCIGVAALIGGILASVGTDLLFGTLYVTPQGRN